MRVAFAAACGAILLLFAPPVFASPPPDAPDDRGLMTLLKDHMAGQPVIAVGIGDIEHGVHFDEAAYGKESKILGRLQAISAAVSADTETYIPYVVRGAWVIAPETRKEVRVDLTGLPDVQAEGGGLLLDQVILSLAPDLLQAAGGDAGIPVTRLSKDAQAMLALALKPPIRITQFRNGIWTDVNGKTHPGVVEEVVGRVTELVDLSNVRVRARLWIQAASVPTVRPVQTLCQQRLQQIRWISGNGGDGLATPDETIANRYKPSDLDGKGYTKPFGAGGLMSVADGLERIQKTTGLKLYPGAYANTPLFVGSPAVTCGEVLDGLRLAITGSWRKVGTGYVLCWNRRGLAAINQMLAETSWDLGGRIGRIASDTYDDSRWLDIAMKMPFAPDDALALTDEQRQTVYSEPPAGKKVDPSAGFEGISYGEMTPDQQNYLEQCAKTDLISIPGKWTRGTDYPDPDHRPFTANDIQSARLGSLWTPYAPMVALDIELPGTGWVRAEDSDLSRYKIRRIRQFAAEREARAARIREQRGSEPTPPQPAPGTFAPKAFTIAAPDRGIMVGPMRGDELDALAGQMKAKRFTTLFYPVLFDGYATLPGRAFPLYRDLKGENGMAAAIAAAKSHGLKIIGYLSPIAWRSQRDATHWLEKHPDWFDRDPLGRTRLEWLKDAARRKVAVPSGAPDIVRSDYVRPTEPEVVRRLQTVVDDFARTSADGVALVDWSTVDIASFQGRVSPLLGFALGDRIAALDKTGFDPLDAQAYPIWPSTVCVSPPGSLLLGRKAVRDVSVDGSGFHNLHDTPERNRYSALAEKLLQHAKTIKKDWTTVVVQNSGAVSDPIEIPVQDPTATTANPKADLLLGYWPRAAADGMIVPDVPWEQADSGGGIPDEARSHSNLLYLDWSKNGLCRNAKMVVLDFRLRPSSIAEVMKYAQ